MKRLLMAALATIFIGSVAPRPALASTFSGQQVFSQSVVEPAYDGTTGQETYLLIPNNATIPSDAPWSPLYLVMYPVNSTVGTLDCLPTNCNHVNVLPPNLETSVYPEGTVSTKYGTFRGGLVKGHDHITTGRDSHVIRHVFLVLFTAQGAADGAINREVTTLVAMQAAIDRGDALAPMDTGLVIHASAVSQGTYFHGP